MTPQEQQMIDGLIDRIRTTRVDDKDTQAEQHIQQGLSGAPDAPYVLVQTVLVQQYGLEQAQSQINELKRQVQALQQQSQQASAPGKSSSGSFLSHIFGSGNPEPPQVPQQSGYQPVNNPGYGAQGYPPPPPPYPQQAYPQQAYPSSGGGLFGAGGGGGFLRSAMQTAAGVAAGELAFQGMEDIFHGFGGGGGRGFEGGSGTGETVVNNYYGDDDRSGDRSGNRDTRDDQNFYNPDNDASRNDLSGSDSNGFTDTSSDDSNFGDSSSDSGGFDTGGGDDFSSDNS